MTTFHLTISRVGENLFDGEARSIALPGTEGMFEVLAHHEAFVSRLRSGKAQGVAADGSPIRFEMSSGGIAEVSNNQATVLL